MPCDIETAVPAAAQAAAVTKVQRRSAMAAVATVALGALALFGCSQVRSSSGAQLLSGHRALAAEAPRALDGGGVQYGVTTAAMSIDARQEQFGGKWINDVLLYSSVDGGLDDHWWQYNAKPVLDKGHGLAITLRFDNGNLQNVISGDYDGTLKNLGRIIGDDGHEVSLRPFHEFNGDWYAWGAFQGHNGNSENQFIEAWQHVVDIVREGGGWNAKWELAYNNENPNDNTSTSFSSFYPGNDYVDMLLASAYNRCGTDEWHTSYESFDEAFGGAYDRLTSISEASGKPIGVAETGATDYCGGDKAAWITDAFNSINSGKYSRLSKVYWFVENADGADWGPQNEDQINAFKNGL